MHSFLFFLCLILCAARLGADESIQQNIFERSFIQPETWALPSLAPGTVDQSGNYNRTIRIAALKNPSGKGVPVSLSYSSNIKYRQSSGWMGLGWQYNPGTITRSVHGGLATDNNDVDYNDNVRERVDFPSLIESGENDESRDIYYLTLPSGETIEFVFWGSGGEWTGAEQTSIVNPPNGIPDPADDGEYREHQFLPLHGENYIIRGYYSGPVSIDGFITRSNIREGGFFREESDYTFFLVTGPDGTTYRYAAPSLGSMDEAIAYDAGMSHQPRYNYYVSAWRIEKIYYATPLVTLITADASFDDSAVDPLNIIAYSYTDAESNISPPGPADGQPPLYQVRYLSAITGYTAQLSFTHVIDDEKDAVYYASLLPADRQDIRKRVTKIEYRRRQTVDGAFFLVQEVDLPKWTALNQRVYLEKIVILSRYQGAGDTLEVYSFEYTERSDFPAFHNDQQNSYANLNGYYSIADLNPFHRNDRLELAHRGQLRRIEYPDGKIETIGYMPWEIEFASDESPRTGISIATRHHPAFSYTPEAYIRSFDHFDPDYDDAHKYSYSIVKQITARSPADSISNRSEDIYSYGLSTFSGIPLNFNLAEIRYVDGDAVERSLDYGMWDGNKYTFITRKNDGEPYFHRIDRVINEHTRIRTTYESPGGNYSAPNGTGNIYVHAAGLNVFYLSMNNMSSPLRGRIQEIETTDLLSGASQLEIIGNGFSYLRLFRDAETLTDGVSASDEEGLLYYTFQRNRLSKRIELRADAVVTVSDEIYNYATGPGEGNVLRSSTRRQHDYGVGFKATPETFEPIYDYFLLTSYNYAFEEPVYQQMKAFNMITYRVEERQNSYYSKSIGVTADTNLVGYLGSKVSTYAEFSSNQWDKSGEYSSKLDSLVLFNYADEGFDSESHVLNVHFRERLPDGREQLTTYPAYYVRYFYGMDGEDPFNPGTSGAYNTGRLVFTEENCIAEPLPDCGFAFEYEYDELGRLIRQSPYFEALTHEYSYDPHSRLAARYVNGELAETYDYSLLNRSDIGGLNSLKSTIYADSLDSLQQIRYIDGLLGEIQSVSGGEGNFRVSEQLFDALQMRPIARTRPVAYDVGSPRFMPDLITAIGAGGDSNLLQGPGIPLSGDIAQSFPANDGPFAYSCFTRDVFGFSRHRYLPGEFMQLNAISYSTNTTFIDYSQSSTDGYRIVTRTDEDGNERIERFNLNGLKIYEGNGSDLNTYFVYNHQMLLSTVIHPDERESGYGYDHLGRLVAIESADQAGALLDTNGEEDSLAINPDHRFIYDDFGRLRFSIDPNQSFAGTMSYIRYDPYGRVLEKGQRASTGGAFSEENANDSTFPQDGDPYLVNYYDIPYTIDGYSGERTTTRLSKRVQYVEGDVYTTIFSYNEAGLPDWIIESGPLGNKFERYIDYDRRNRLTEYEITFDGRIIQHLWIEYDDFGRVEEIYFNDQGLRPANAAVAYQYNAADLPELLVLGNGLQSVEYSYNTIGWLTAINDIQNPGDDQFAISLDYWGSGIAGAEDRYSGLISAAQSLTPALAAATLTETFQYDHLQRIGSATTLDGNDSYSSSYSYDIMGNFGSLSRNSLGVPMDILSYSYEGNRLESVSDAVDSGEFDNDFDQFGNGTYGYDANGNVILDENRRLSSLTYNHYNLPSQIIGNDGSIRSYGYGADGKRIWKKRNGEITGRYLRNEAGDLVAEVIPSEQYRAVYCTFTAEATGGITVTSTEGIQTEISDGEPASVSFVFAAESVESGISFRAANNLPVAITVFSEAAAPEVAYSVIPGPGGVMLGERRYPESGSHTDYYYLKDHLNNIRAKVREDGEVAAATDYYPFGEVRREYLGGIAEAENKFKFQSKERDAFTGLDYVEARYYDASIGRFTAPDPLADAFTQVSPYNYGLNNPLYYVDPGGAAPDSSSTKAAATVAVTIAVSEPTPIGEVLVLAGVAAYAVVRAGEAVFDYFLTRDNTHDEEQDKSDQPDTPADPGTDAQAQDKTVDRPNIYEDGESALEQLQGIENEQRLQQKRDRPDKIESINKSKQNLNNKLRSIRNLKDAQDLFGNGGK